MGGLHNKEFSTWVSQGGGAGSPHFGKLPFKGGNVGATHREPLEHSMSTQGICARWQVHSYCVHITFWRLGSHFTPCNIEGLGLGCIGGDLNLVTCAYQTLPSGRGFKGLGFSV